MNRIAIVTEILLVIGWQAQASADGFLSRWFSRVGVRKSTDSNECLRPDCCPNDYCRKSMPCLKPPTYCGSQPDYCRKPLPCIFPAPCVGDCDDYCRKVLPCRLCPTGSPFLQCGHLHHAVSEAPYMMTPLHMPRVYNESGTKP